MVGALVAGMAAAQFQAVDPSDRCLNARVIGLGRTFVGLADDASALYINPAGLARTRDWQLDTLSGKFLEDYSYLSLAGVYPTQYGNFALGLGGYSIGGAYATKMVEGSDPNDPIYEIDMSQPQISNSNYVYSLAYATGLERLYNKLAWADKVSLGANLKLFNVGLSGDSISNGNATGTQLDLGLLVTPHKALTLGAAFQNVLPGSLGGTLNYASGHKEGFPHNVKVGGALKLLGQQNALYKTGQEVMLLADMDYQIQVAKTLPLYHLGVEWSPITMIAIRAGIDQAIEGDGTGANIQTVNNLAGGVGVKYGGFRFDYGYHSFVTLPGVSNSFFSLSYSPVKLVEETGERLTVQSDKLMTYDEKLAVTGAIKDPRIRSLLVSGRLAKFDLKGNFNQPIDLTIGKNALVVEGKDAAGKLIDQKKVRVLRLQPFPDVPEGYWTREKISLLAMQGVLTGYPNGTFKPEGNITRAEMATLLMKSRGASLESAANAGFKDVPVKHWAARFIAQAAEQGIVKGYPGNLFKPNGNITRAEGLAMIARFAGISEETYSNIFPDLPATHWSAGLVEGAFRVNILDYLQGKNLEPNKLLSRAETVEMLYQTDYMQWVLKKDLLNWDSY
ncbi:MAG: S-layer homology domain-containing protein [Candidatus Margulisiibacteriota bacterium]